MALRGGRLFWRDTIPFAGYVRRCTPYGSSKHRPRTILQAGAKRQLNSTRKSHQFQPDGVLVNSQPPQDGSSSGWFRALRGFVRRHPKKVGVWATFMIAWTTYWGVHALANRETVPITGRKRYRVQTGYLSGLIDDQQKKLEEDDDRGRQMNPPAPKLSYDNPHFVRAKGIFDRLIASAGLQDLPWSLDVVADEGLNLEMSRSRSNVSISEGFLTTFESDDELGAILAHKLGHAVAGHSREEASIWILLMFQWMPWAYSVCLPGLLVAGSGLLLWRRTWLTRGLLMAGVPTVFHPFSISIKEQFRELEADQIGLLLMTDAGYDPAAAVSAREITTERQKQPASTRRFFILDSKGKVERRQRLHGQGRIKHMRAEVPKARTIVSLANGINSGIIDGEHAPVDSVSKQTVQGWKTFVATRGRND